jgi:hypothetical protein
MKKQSRKVKKAGPEKVMAQARVFLEMKTEFFAKLSQISEENTAMVDEIEEIILSEDSSNHFCLTFFLNALCHSSKRNPGLLKFVLEKRNPALFEKLVEFGFKDQLLKIGR